MPNKDSSQKILEAYNDVFADIVNVLLFDGEPVLDPDELEDESPRSFYKAAGELHEIERDVAKRWKKNNIRLACIGVENQTKADADMPLRVMAYDGAEYRAQLLPENTTNDRYPVVTLVLYFGFERHWNRPTSLLERLNVPEKLRPFVNDYKINLFEVAYLSREQVQKFKSDFRVVADYFVQMRETRDYQPDPQTLKHVQETLQLLSIMNGDHRYEEVYNQSVGKGGVVNMCEVFDRVQNRGIRIGEQRGIQIGEQRGEQRGIRIGEQRGIRIGEQRGEQRGIRIGEQRGEQRRQYQMMEVFNRLKAAGRIDDCMRVMSDAAYMDQMIVELGIGDEPPVRH